MSFKVINDLTAYEAALFCAFMGLHIEDLIEAKLVTCPAEFRWDDEEISRKMPKARKFVKSFENKPNVEIFCPQLAALWADHQLLKRAAEGNEYASTPTGWLTYEGWVGLEQDSGAIGYGRRTRAQDSLEYWGKRAQRLAKVAGSTCAMTRFAGRI